MEAFITNQVEKVKANLSANVFLVTKKRLTDKVLEFIAFKNIGNEIQSESEVLKYLLVARNLFAVKNEIAGYKLIQKAEKKALTLSNFALLHEIYHTMCYFSFSLTANEQDDLFEKMNLNLLKLKAKVEIDNKLARLKQRFYEAKRQRSNINFTTIIADYNQLINEKSTLRIRDLLELLILIDAQAEDFKSYASINISFQNESFFLESAQNISDNERIHYLKFYYLLANIYFRKKDFNQSLVYLDLMNSTLLNYSGKYIYNFKNDLVTLRSLNLNFQGKYSAAIVLCENALAANRGSETDLLKVIMVRIMIHIQQGEFIAASSLFATLNKTDYYYLKTQNLEWLLHKNYMEIILHVELRNYDYVESRINSLIRKYRNYFLEKSNIQAIPFLKLLKEVYKTPKTIPTKAYEQKVENTLNWKVKKEEDIFLMCFYGWLKAKMIGKPIYETTLEVIRD